MASLDKRSIASLQALVDTLLPPLNPPLSESLEVTEIDRCRTHQSLSHSITKTILCPPPIHSSVHNVNQEAKEDKSDNISSNKFDNKMVFARHRFWSHDLTSNEDVNQENFINILCETIQTKIAAHDRDPLLLFLHALSSPLGTFLIFQNVPNLCRFKAFNDWTLEERVNGLQRIRDSWVVSLREGFSGVKRLICGLAFSYVSKDQSLETFPMKPSQANRMNPYWEAIEYPGPIHNHIVESEDEKGIKDAGHFSNGGKDAFLKLSPEEDQDGRKGMKSQVESDSEFELEYDVVVIGSGAGGSVAASILSKDNTVLIIEKGSYESPSSITNIESEAYDKMYEKHGLLTTDDKNIMIMAGSTVGGGTTINWGCCIDTPKYVRKEWAEPVANGRVDGKGGHSLEQFQLGGQFDESLQSIKERISCHTPPDHGSCEGNNVSDHNTMNSLFKHSCHSSNFSVENTGRNFKDALKDSAGYTCFGDRYGNKQGTLVTFLRDAVEKNGAKILPDCGVDYILHEWCSVTEKNVSGAKPKRRRKAVGVLATVGKGDNVRKVSIRARKCVIVSAGSLHTPCILLRSKFRNWHIGRHLHLHPVSVVVGIHRDNQNERAESINNDGKMSSKTSSSTSQDLSRSLKSSCSQFGGSIRGYLGAPMTLVCNDFQAGPNDDGYGAKLECPVMHPGLLGAGYPWINPTDFKLKLLHMKNSLAVVVLQRDKGEGRVMIGPDGFNPRIKYELAEQDKESMLNAIKGCVKLLVSGGADFIATGNNNDYGLDLEKEQLYHHAKGTERHLVSEDPKVKSYLEDIQTRGIHKHRMGIFSAHQMGTCRMGTSPNNSVVDQNGEMWECDNLFVMDTSVFPTASGANPMLTVLSISHMLSSRLATRIQYEEGRLKEDSIEYKKCQENAVNRFGSCTRNGIGSFFDSIKVTAILSFQSWSSIKCAQWFVIICILVTNLYRNDE